MARQSVVFLDRRGALGEELIKLKLEADGYVAVGTCDDTGECETIIFEDTRNATEQKRRDIHRRHERLLHSVWETWGDVG